MVDSNHAYSFTEALAFARRIEPLAISWFEEPLSPEDYAGYAELRQRTSIPIAAGECEYLSHGFHRLFSARAIDIAQPDLCAAGGLTEDQRRGARTSASHRSDSALLGHRHRHGDRLAFHVGLGSATGTPVSG
jgi:D-galactarolactone cycloisomerase